jgi:hypothetical protein
VAAELQPTQIAYGACMAHTRSAITRDYHLSRPDFNPPEKVTDYSGNYDVETAIWEGLTSEDVMDEYIDKVEEQAEEEPHAALHQALDATIDKITRPIFEAEKQQAEAYISSQLHCSIL